MDEFCNKINAYLKIKNSTSYLKMIYKKVLFSICFTGKKKYFRIKYKKIVNFKLKKLFTKGIDAIKQEQFHLFKFVEKKIMRKVMNINNLRSIYKIVENTLRDVSLKQQEFDQFIVIVI